MNKKAEVIASETQHYFEKCSSTDELKEYLKEIKRINGVKDAYISGNALYVDVKDWGKVAYIYQPEYDFEVDDDLKNKLSELSAQFTKTQTKGRGSGNNHYSVCIGNQLFNNEDLGYIYHSNTAFALVSILQLYGIECSVVQPSLEWISSGMYNYDSVILLTHGSYDNGLHWILTSEELGLENWMNKYSEAEKQLAEKGNAYIMPAYVSETRGGKVYRAWYLAVSDLYINSTNSRGFYEETPHIVFSAACHSLEGNNSLAEAFINKGADYFFGYDNENCVGPKAFADFFVKLAEGKSIAEAYSTMGYKIDPKTYAELHCVPNIDVLSDAWMTYIVPPMIPSKFALSLSNQIQISRGYYPPMIEGEYYVSPLIYQYGNWPYYYPGLEISPVYISFSGQDNDNMTINVEIINSNGLERTSGIGHLGGFGNQFSVYVNGQGQGTGYAYDDNYELYSFSQTYTADIILSGAVNGTYIDGFQYGFTITGKSAEPTPYAIVHVADVGTTMVFRDGDGVSGYYPLTSVAYSTSSIKEKKNEYYDVGCAFVCRQTPLCVN